MAIRPAPATAESVMGQVDPAVRMLRTAGCHLMIDRSHLSATIRREMSAYWLQDIRMASRMLSDELSVPKGLRLVYTTAGRLSIDIYSKNSLDMMSIVDVFDAEPGTRTEILDPYNFVTVDETPHHRVDLPAIPIGRRYRTLPVSGEGFFGRVNIVDLAVDLAAQTDQTTLGFSVESK